MEDKTQYNQSSGTGTVSVPSPKQVSTRTPTDIKVAQLEEQLAAQHSELAKLRRDIIRLKNQISDVELLIRNRG